MLTTLNIRWQYLDNTLRKRDRLVCAHLPAAITTTWQRLSETATPERKKKKKKRSGCDCTGRRWRSGWAGGFHHTARWKVFLAPGQEWERVKRRWRLNRRQLVGLKTAFFSLIFFFFPSNERSELRNGDGALSCSWIMLWHRFKSLTLRLRVSLNAHRSHLLHSGAKYQ